MVDKIYRKIDNGLYEIEEQAKYIRRVTLESLQEAEKKLQEQLKAIQEDIARIKELEGIT